MSRPLDGVDLVPFVTGSNANPPHPQLFWRMHRKQLLAVRAGDNKLMRDLDSSTVQLYDLADDVGESNNLVEERPQIVSTMRAQIETWAEQLQPPAFPGLGSWKHKTATKEASR